MKQEGNAQRSGYAHNDHHALEQVMKFNIQHGIIGTMHTRSLPYQNQRQRAEQDHKQKIALFHRLYEPIVNEADDQENNIGKEDQGRYIDDGRQGKMSAFPEEHVEKQAKNGGDDACKNGSENGFGKDGVVSGIHDNEGLI